MKADYITGVGGLIDFGHVVRWAEALSAWAQSPSSIQSLISRREIESVRGRRGRVGSVSP